MYVKASILHPGYVNSISVRNISCIAESCNSIPKIPYNKADTGFNLLINTVK